MMNKEYKHGWHLLMEYDEFPKGLNEDIVRALSAKKQEPEWLLDFRLRAYRRWLTMAEPDWSDNRRGPGPTAALPPPHPIMRCSLLSTCPARQCMCPGHIMSLSRHLSCNVLVTWIAGAWLQEVLLCCKHPLSPLPGHEKPPDTTSCGRRQCGLLELP